MSNKAANTGTSAAKLLRERIVIGAMGPSHLTGSGRNSRRSLLRIRRRISRTTAISTHSAASDNDLRHPPALPRSQRGHHRGRTPFRHEHRPERFFVDDPAQYGGRKDRRFYQGVIENKFSTASRGKSTSNRPSNAANGARPSQNQTGRPRFVGPQLDL